MFLFIKTTFFDETDLKVALFKKIPWFAVIFTYL